MCVKETNIIIKSHLLFDLIKALFKTKHTLDRLSFNNCMDRILPSFYSPLPSCVDSFYTLSVDKSDIFDPLPPMVP